MNLSLVYRSFLRYDIFKRYDIFTETGSTMKLYCAYKYNCLNFFDKRISATYAILPDIFGLLYFIIYAILSSMYPIF